MYVFIQVDMPTAGDEVLYSFDVDDGCEHGLLFEPVLYEHVFVLQDIHDPQH